VFILLHILLLARYVSYVGEEDYDISVNNNDDPPTTDLSFE